MTKDRINTYTCEACREQTVTIDIDEGVTPFMLDCRATEGCTGWARSAMYQVPDPKPKPSWEWYRATDNAARRMGGDSWTHHDNGGLFLRRILPKIILMPDGTRYAASKTGWRRIRKMEKR